MTLSKVLAVVPARGGSKGLPGKNLADLGGRPLLAWTADAARRCSVLDRVVLSTDDDLIAQAGLACGLEVPFRRPASLAADDTPMVQVLQHALDWVVAEGGMRPDIVVLLQPTSPFRGVDDIARTVAALRSADADAAVTVELVPHRYSPESLMVADADGILRGWASPLGSVGRRQAKERVFARNGPAVLAVRASVLEGGSLYGDKTVGVEMPPASGIDIDTDWDLRVARAFVADRPEV
jgi:CMP-N,N'-diacetyllegionaminic acid synthase